MANQKYSYENGQLVYYAGSLLIPKGIYVLIYIYQKEAYDILPDSYCSLMCTRTEIFTVVKLDDIRPLTKVEKLLYADYSNDR